jgi:hypothetical protein
MGFKEWVAGTATAAEVAKNVVTGGDSQSAQLGHYQRLQAEERTQRATSDEAVRAHNEARYRLVEHREKS